MLVWEYPTYHLHNSNGLDDGGDNEIQSFFPLAKSGRKLTPTSMLRMQGGVKVGHDLLVQLSFAVFVCVHFTDRRQNLSSRLRTSNPKLVKVTVGQGQKCFHVDLLLFKYRLIAFQWQLLQNSAEIGFVTAGCVTMLVNSRFVMYNLRTDAWISACWRQVMCWRTICRTEVVQLALKRLTCPAVIRLRINVTL